LPWLRRYFFDAGLPSEADVKSNSHGAGQARKASVSSMTTSRKPTVNLFSLLNHVCTKIKELCLSESLYVDVFGVDDERSYCED